MMAKTSKNYKKIKREINSWEELPTRPTNSDYYENLQGLNAPEQKTDYLVYFFAEKVHRSTTELYDAKKKEEQTRTASLANEIRKELAKLTTAQKGLAKELEKAIEYRLVEPGEYAFSFLDHLGQMIKNIRKKVENSQDWLVLWNQREKRKGAFWGNFMNKKKGGTQFLLSSEHYMTRSEG